MAVGDVTVMNRGKFTFGNNLHLTTDTFRCYLLAGWTPNIDTHHFLSDIVANEIALAGYTAGGVTLASLTWTENDTDDRSQWDFANPTWASIATGTISYAAIVKWTGVATTSPILLAIEVSNSNGQSYTITLPATGILHVRQAV